VGIRVGRVAPVIVYQMGKVASSAVRNALLLHGVRPVLHLHSFFPLRDLDAKTAPVDEGLRGALGREVAQAQRVYQEASWRKKLELRYREKIYNELVYRQTVEPNKRTRFITLVRDPVAANLSMFFQIFEEYAGVPYTPDAFTIQQLTDLFLERYDHSRPLTWFDAELKPMIGIDAYASDFPTDEGSCVLHRDEFDLLILQAELDDASKEKAISSFLGLEGFRMLRSNVAGDKVYADQYRATRDAIRIPEKMLEPLYGSKYAQHFYSPTDLDKFRARWNKEASA
jgi:hypothetical protein